MASKRYTKGLPIKLRDNLLIEIGCEELPAAELPQLIDDFEKAMIKWFEENKLIHDKIYTFATPRRLALIVRDLDMRQDDSKETKIGPSLTAGYDKDGKPTAAAIGFAKGCGIDVANLQKVDTPKGKYLSADILIKGKELAELLSADLEDIIQQLPRGRTMRWHGMRHTEYEQKANGDEKKYRFVRAIRWLVAMIGPEVIPWQAFSLKAGRHSYGHRFYSPQKIEIKHSGAYQESLKSSYVIASLEERKQLISEGVEKISQQHQAKALLDAQLLTELAGITEYPHVYQGEFHNKFLELPNEVLQSVLRIKQKYIPLINQNTGAMLNKFIFVANIESKDPQLLIEGNQAVISPRLEDAKFFYELDLHQGLQRDKLKKVAFFTGLGNMLQQSNRCKDLSILIAKSLMLEKQEIALIKEAAELCKCDLTSLMVQEFPELQGIMGAHYLRAVTILGSGNKSSLIMAEHYLPRGAGDKIPPSNGGRILAIADRIDKLVGLFSLGHKPKGDKDPYALRRSALAIARIIIEAELDIDLAAIIENACKLYAKHNKKDIDSAQITGEIVRFVNERLAVYLKEKEGISSASFDLVFYCPQPNLLSAAQKTNAVNKHDKENLKTLVEINKRLSNIIKRDESPDELSDQTKVDNKLLQLAAEQDLYALIVENEEKMGELIKQAKYKEYLAYLQQMQEPLSKFFDEVMVMVDDKKLQHNRLRLLLRVQRLFMEIGDFTKISADF